MIFSSTRALSEALDLSRPVILKTFESIRLQTRYDQLDKLLHLIKQYNGIVSHKEYADVVNLRVQAPSGVAEDFRTEAGNFATIMSPEEGI